MTAFGTPSEPPRFGVGTDFPPGPAERLGVRDRGDAPPCPLNQLMDMFHYYGDVVRFQTRFNTFFLFSHPTHVREILHRHHYVRSPLIKTLLGDGLLAADGPYWERQRRLMLPAFQQNAVDKMVAIFSQVTADRVGTWTDHLDANSRFNLSREMDRIALSNICRGLFGTDLDDDFLDAFGLVMREIAAMANAAVFGWSLIRKANTNRQFQAAMQVIEAAVESVVQSAGHIRSDEVNLLKVLHDARRGPDDERLTHRQIRDEIITMITAGHETTAVVLSWAWFAIASHPHVAEKFYHEVDNVLGQRRVTASDLPRLKYTRMIVDETIRMYPPVWLISRKVLRDDQIGGCHIPAGAGALISPYVLHRHPEFWDNPETFDPERFDGRTDEQEVYSYIPFLRGRHLCIGKQFALTEAVVVLATIAQQCRIHLADQCRPAYDPLLSLRIRGGLHVTAQRRIPAEASA